MSDSSINSENIKPITVNQFYFFISFSTPPLKQPSIYITVTFFITQSMK